MNLQYFYCMEVIQMKLNTRKVKLAWARTEKTAAQLAKVYGCTQQCMTALLSKVP